MPRTMLTVSLSAALALCLLFAASAICDSSTHRYTAYKTSEGIHVDGKLDENVWQNAQAVNLSAKNGGEPGQATTVRMLWDEHYLYFSWDCVDSHVWSTMTRRDMPLYNEEVVEVFIDADSNREETTWNWKSIRWVFSGTVSFSISSQRMGSSIGPESWPGTAPISAGPPGHVEVSTTSQTRTRDGALRWLCR